MIYFLIISYFLIPKINVIEIPNSIQQIRIDDFITLIMLFYIIYKNNIKKKIVINLPIILYLSIVFVSLAFAVNLDLYVALSSARIIQYFIVALFIANYVNIIKFLDLIIYFSIFNAFIGILQIYLGLPGLTSYEVQYNVTRAYGTTGGAWEYGALLSLGFFAIVVKIEKFKHSFNLKILLIIITIFLGLILSGSRSQLPILGVILLYLLYVYVKSYRIYTIPVFLLFFLILMLNLENINLYFLDDFTLSQRSGKLNPFDNIRVMVSIFKENYHVYDGSWKIKYDFNNIADQSFVMRAFKWSSAINFYTINLPYSLLGLGPGALGDSLDNGILRSFLEYGFLIIFVYIISIHFFLKYYGLLPFCIFLSYIIPTMIFIDIHLSAKIQPLHLCFIIFAALINENIKEK